MSKSLLKDVTEPRYLTALGKGNSFNFTLSLFFSKPSTFNWLIEKLVL